MICKKCGATIEDNSTECKFCRAKYPENEAKAQPEKDVSTEPVEDAGDTRVIDTDKVNTAAEADEAEEENEFSGEEIDRMLDENEKNRRRQQDRLNAEKQRQLQEIEKRRQQKKRKQIRNRLLIALAILVVLGGVGTGVYYLQTQNGGVPDVEVVTEEPAFTPDVVSEAVTEVPTEESTEAPAAPTQQANWQSSGTSSTGAAAGVSGNAASGSGAGKSTAPAAGGSAKQSSGTSKSAAPAAGSGAKQNATASTGSKNTVSTSSAQPKSGAKYSATGGYDGEKFNAALVTGKEVVTGGGKKYLTFDFNGATYYANIDSSSSTADVAGKPMTINAYKTSEVYNGASVYEITALTKYNSSYVFPESGYRLLTEADLKGKSARELYIGRNEIYARHGRQFTDKSLQTYFNSCSWYKIKTSYNTANDAANLNSIELANANFIKKYEDSHK